jgi:hypothetical protein
MQIHSRQLEARVESIRDCIHTVRPCPLPCSARHVGSDFGPCSTTFRATFPHPGTVDPRRSYPHTGSAGSAHLR